MTTQDLYQQAIKPLPTAERLRLARMILNDIPAESLVETSDAWSEEDLREFTAASWDGIESDADEKDAEPR